MASTQSTQVTEPIAGISTKLVILYEYNKLAKDKKVMNNRLRELEKEYLRLLVRSCNYNDIVCENCWQVVKHFKGANEHLYQGGYLCKNRTMEYTLLKAIKETPKLP